MKVKVITTYQDKELKKLVKAGEEFEATEDRAKTLIEAKVAKAVELTKDTAAVPPKKRTTKKNTAKTEEA